MCQTAGLILRHYSGTNSRLAGNLLAAPAEICLGMYQYLAWRPSILSIHSRIAP
jgi:hypothetical protein